jgi:hypothetical protein
LKIGLDKGLGGISGFAAFRADALLKIFKLIKVNVTNVAAGSLEIGNVNDCIRTSVVVYVLIRFLRIYYA